jgi:hypothetical protein
LLWQQATLAVATAHAAAATAVAAAAAAAAAPRAAAAAELAERREHVVLEQRQLADDGAGLVKADGVGDVLSCACVSVSTKHDLV